MLVRKFGQQSSGRLRKALRRIYSLERRARTVVRALELTSRGGISVDLIEICTLELVTTRFLIAGSVLRVSIGGSRSLEGCLYSRHRTKIEIFVAVSTLCSVSSR